MGEVAEMMLDGTLCEGCGVYLGDPVGYPRRCGWCRKGQRTQLRAVCPKCSKRVKVSGLSDHMRDAHPGHAEREKATHETALRDMLDSARSDLEVIREALGVPVEPHQSLIERMVEAAQARRGAVPDWWKPMPVESSLELAALFRGAEEAALLSGYDHADAFHCGYRAMLAGAPAPAPAECRTCNGHGMVGGLLPNGGGYQSDQCPECTAPALRGEVKPEKCDGSHAGPRCADPECWNDDAPIENGDDIMGGAA